MAALDQLSEPRCRYPLCSQEFSTHSEVQDHFREVHPLITLDRCPVCKKTFPNEVAICNHYRKSHPVMPEPAMPAMITCPRPGCAELFNKRNDFYRHWEDLEHPVYRLTGHARERFRCIFDFCRATYKSEALVKIHYLLIHTVDRTYNPVAGPSNPIWRPHVLSLTRLSRRSSHIASGPNDFGLHLPSRANNNDLQRPVPLDSETRSSVSANTSGHQTPASSTSEGRLALEASNTISMKQNAHTPESRPTLPTDSSKNLHQASPAPEQRQLIPKAGNNSFQNSNLPTFDTEPPSTAGHETLNILDFPTRHRSKPKYDRKHKNPQTHFQNLTTLQNHDLQNHALQNCTTMQNQAILQHQDILSSHTNQTEYQGTAGGSQGFDFPMGHQGNPITIDGDFEMSIPDWAEQESYTENLALEPHEQLLPSRQFPPTDDFHSVDYGLLVFKLILESQSLIPIFTPHEAMDIWNLFLAPEQRRSVVEPLMFIHLRNNPAQALAAVQSTLLAQLIEDWVKLKLLARKLPLRPRGWRTDSALGTAWAVLAYCFELEDLREDRINPAFAVDRNVPNRLWRPKTGREITQASGFDKIMDALVDRVYCRKLHRISFQLKNVMIPLEVVAYVEELREVTAYLYPHPEDVLNIELWKSFSNRRLSVEMHD